MGVNRLSFLALTFAVAVALGCGRSGGDGTVADQTELPSDSALTLYGENEGVYPETCVLEDPRNPYASVLVDEETKWELHDAAPSAKAKFYLWATALARSPSGENQYYTATALHQLFTEGGSENAREQAKKAYRSVLDNFYFAATHPEAWWLPGKPTYADPLKDLVGKCLVQPSDLNFSPLYGDPFLARSALSEWGYAWVVTLEYQYDANHNVLGTTERGIVERAQ